MKLKLSQLIFLLVCICTFSSAAAAQKKLQALKFDEFDENVDSQFYTYHDEINFSQRIERFIKQLNNGANSKHLGEKQLVT